MSQQLRRLWCYLFGHDFPGRGYWRCSWCGKEG